MPEASYLVISNKQAAQMFRSFYNKLGGGCQYEGGRMRWWLQGNMLLEQVFTGGEIQWRLSMVPDRNCRE